MTSYNFTDDYAAGMFTGSGLHERLGDGKELVLTVTAVDRKSFNDAPQSQWVLSFGPSEQQLRVKPMLGRPLFEAFGNSSGKWIGRQVALSAEFISWTPKGGDDPGEGWTIKARPMPEEPGKSNAVTTGVEKSETGRRDFGQTLDDKIPF